MGAAFSRRPSHASHRRSTSLPKRRALNRNRTGLSQASFHRTSNVGLRQLHHTEVCTLSGQGKFRTPMQPITGCRSLSPRSHAGSLDSFPYGSPATRQIQRNNGEESGLPRSHRCRPECSRACPFSACLSPGSADDDVLSLVMKATGCIPFWFGPDSRFGPPLVTRFSDSSVELRMRNLPGTSHRTAAGSVDFFLVAEVNRQSRGTLSPELHTRPLPVTHVRIGNCWSYSRSQSQQSRLPALGVTRQRRALPPTACRITRG